jgi:hypothetical protein
LSLQDYKLNAFTKKVGDSADQPSGTPAEIKAIFDAAPEELRQKFNSLIDALLSAYLSKWTVSTAWDINGYTENGAYRVGDELNILHASFPNNAYHYGTLVVQGYGQSVTQTYYTHDGNMYYRTKWNDSDWHPWKKVTATDA